MVKVLVFGVFFAVIAGCGKSGDTEHSAEWHEKERQIRQHQRDVRQKEIEHDKKFFAEIEAEQAEKDRKAGVTKNTK